MLKWIYTLKRPASDGDSSNQVLIPDIYCGVDGCGLESIWINNWACAKQIVLQRKNNFNDLFN